MALGLAALLAAAGAGAVGLGAYGNAKGGGGPIIDSRRSTKSSQDVYHQPYENFNPNYVIAPQSSSIYSPTYVIDSPQAKVKSTPRIDATYDLNNRPQWDFPTDYNQSGPKTGTNMVNIAIVIAVGVIAYGMMSKPKRKTRKR